jgi:ubiquinone/menaquinone biosynthesis C-methylase UbiE
MMMPSEPSVGSVHAFWNTEACGTHFVTSFVDEREFFEKFREHRFKTEWHLPLLVPFTESRDRKILEIGIGNGADGAMFALNGGDYTGVDLTEAALDATRRHFEVLGLSGIFRKEDAERLSFPDSTFDLVYSHGVLHHTPDTQKAVSEVHRVLKPGGQAIVMLYHKHSFNYYIRIMTYMRLRVLLKALSRIGSWRSDRAQVRSRARAGLRGNRDRRIWQVHYQNFLEQGWGYLRPRTFVHHCTDGPECPIARAYSRTEATRLFAAFRDLRFRVAHLPLNKYPVARRLPFVVEKFLASRFGWYLFIFGTK